MKSKFIKGSCYWIENYYKP